MMLKHPQVTPLMIGVAAVVVTAATYACASRFKARSVSPISRKFYKGGFKPQMTRREAALILGVRYTTKILLVATLDI